MPDDADVAVLQALLERVEAEQLQARQERVKLRVEVVALATKMGVAAVVAGAAVGGLVSWIMSR